MSKTAPSHSVKNQTTNVMIKHLLNKASPYVRRTILAGLVGSSGLTMATSALAQDTNAPTKLKPTVVTGSLIPTADTVGATAVQTLPSAAIEQAGTADTLTTLRKLVPDRKSTRLN